MGSLVGGAQSATHPDALLQLAKSPPDEELPLDDELEDPDEELDVTPEEEAAEDPDELVLELALLDAELCGVPEVEVPPVPAPVLAVLAEPPELPLLPAVVLLVFVACDDPHPRAAAVRARTTARFRPTIMSYF
jgi:hypothetical protein